MTTPLPDCTLCDREPLHPVHVNTLVEGHHPYDPSTTDFLLDTLTVSHVVSGDGHDVYGYRIMRNDHEWVGFSIERDTDVPLGSLIHRLMFSLLDTLGVR